MEKKYKLKKTLLICMGVMLALIILLKLYNQDVSTLFKTSTYTLSSLSELIAQNPEDKNFFAAFNKKMIIGSKDGLRLLKIDGNEIWNTPFSLQNPELLVEDKKIAVADIGGKEIQVFDYNKLSHVINTSYPIVMATMNKQGKVAVVEKTKVGRVITVYEEEEGKPIFRYNIVPEKDGYPMGVALNEQGDKLVASLLDVAEVELSSKMLFFKLNDIDTDYVDQIVAAKTDNGVIGKVIALGDTFVGVSTKKVQGYYFGQEVEERFAFDLYNKVVLVDQDTSKDHFAIAYGDPFPGKEANYQDQLHIYDINGNELNVYNSAGTITYLNMEQDDLIVGSRNEFVALQPNGKLKWRYTATMGIKEVVPLGKGKVLMVGEKYYQIFERVDKDQVSKTDKKE